MNTITTQATQATQASDFLDYVRAAQYIRAVKQAAVKPEDTQAVYDATVKLLKLTSSGANTCGDDTQTLLFKLRMVALVESLSGCSYVYVEGKKGIALETGAGSDTLEETRNAAIDLASYALAACLPA